MGSISTYKYNYTVIPPTIAKIHRQHFCTAAKIELWLNQIRCETLHTSYARKGIKSLCKELTKKTRFEIEVRHDNDYIEIGPNINDPKGEMFYIITPFRVAAKFKPENMLYVTQQLELFSKRDLPINIKLDKVSLSFYSHQRKIECGDLGCSARYGIKLAYDLKFEIKHVWKSKWD